jgi:regulator of RNase E activity RraA
VSIGGIVVNPGDVVVGDLNGVVIVPRDIADELVERLVSRRQAEADYTASVARGDFSNAWVDEILIGSGVIIEEPDKVG